MAAAIDTMEDKLRELLEEEPELEEQVARLIAELGVDADERTMRVVVGIAAGMLRTADDRGALQEMFGVAAPVREDLGAFATKLMGLIDGDRNPRLQARCVDFVLGTGFDGGKNQTQIASEEGVNKATVSARCRNLVRTLGRAPARGMKSEEACRRYSKRQEGRRARPEREPWSFQGLLTSVFGQPVLIHGASA